MRGTDETRYDWEDWDEYDFSAYLDWVEGLSPERQQAELERIREDTRRIEVEAEHLRRLVHTRRLWEPFHRSWGEMISSHFRGSQMLLTGQTRAIQATLLIAKIAEVEPDRAIKADLGDLVAEAIEVRDTGLPFAEWLRATAAIIHAHALLDRFVLNTFALLQLSRQIADWASSENATGSLGIDLYGNMVQATKAAVREFTAPRRRLDRVRMISEILGSPIEMDKTLMRAWQYHADLRNELAHGPRVAYMPVDGRRADIVGLHVQPTEVLVSDDEAAGVLSVTECVLISLIRGLSRAFDIELLPEDVLEQLWETSLENSHLWFSEPIRRSA